MTKFLTWVAVIALFTWESSAHAQNVKLGFVNLDRIIKESVPAQAASKRLESEFSTRQKEVEELTKRYSDMSTKLERDVSVISETEKQKRLREINDLERELQRKRDQFREDLNARRNEELSSLLNRAGQILRDIGSKEGFDLIFQENVVYASPKVDITDYVMKELEKTQ